MMPSPLPFCPRCPNTSGNRPPVIRFGSFFRESDRSRHQRFKCFGCRKTFSFATTNPCFRQKKRHLNPIIFEFLASGVSQRRLASSLRANRKTVVRKFLFLGVQAHFYLNLDRLSYPPVVEWQFDDLETMEHSKLKPLSVILAVDKPTRRILGFKVARMPCKGLLAKKALQKYGPRKDERREKREELFQELTNLVVSQSLIQSDLNPHYGPSVQRHFPEATHLTYEGRRGCVVGQGELKAGGFDPLFSLNHTFAMCRANINRLFRRTWNTTKKPERLDLHLAIYSLYHNWRLI